MAGSLNDPEPFTKEIISGLFLALGANSLFFNNLWIRQNANNAWGLCCVSQTNFSFLKLIRFVFSQNLNHRFSITCQAGFTSCNVQKHSFFSPTERCCWTRTAVTSSNYCVTGLQVHHKHLSSVPKLSLVEKTLWRVWRVFCLAFLCHFLSVILCLLAYVEQEWDVSKYPHLDIITIFRSEICGMWKKYC